MRYLAVLSILLAGAAAVFAQAADRPLRTIFSNSSYRADYEVRDGNVIITLETLDDFTDNTGGQDPDFGRNDFTQIVIDKNYNSTIDEKIDIAFSTRKGTTVICPQFLYHEAASSLCGQLRSKATVKVSFSATESESKPHPVFQYTIPRPELVSGDTPGEDAVVLMFHTGSRGRYYFPQQPAMKHFLSLKATHRLEI